MVKSLRGPGGGVVKAGPLIKKNFFRATKKVIGPLAKELFAAAFQTINFEFFSWSLKTISETHYKIFGEQPLY